MRLFAVAGWLLVALAAGSTVRAADAARPAGPEPKALDKALYDTLRDVHNRGADLYNGGDPVGCYRLFQGSLQVARAALGHRPAEQKLIDEGLAAADREPSVTRRAFRLHEVIEQVRASIRPEGPRPEVRKPEPPAEKKGVLKIPEGPHYEPLPVMPREIVPEQKPERKKEPATESPFGGKTVPPQPARPAAGVAGRVLFQGKPMPGADLAFVSRGAPEPRVYETSTRVDGTYRLDEVQPGAYTVLLTAGKAAPVKAFPDRYAVTNTSPLVIDVRPGGDTLDFMLQ